MKQSLTTPLVALALAIIPFFVFLGASNTVTLNGEVVADSRFNLGGLIAAVIGLGLVFSTWRSPATSSGLRKGLAALAGVLCLVQVANAVDLVRIEPLDWVMPDRDLPALEYSGLRDVDRIHLSVKTPDAYRRSLASRKSTMVTDARLHQAYADLCHGGRYRVDLERAEALPDYFDAAELSEIERLGALRAEAVELQCSDRQSARYMGAEVDALNRDMDMFDRLEAEYLALVQ